MQGHRPQRIYLESGNGWSLLRRWPLLGWRTARANLATVPDNYPLLLHPGRLRYFVAALQGDPRSPEGFAEARRQAAERFSLPAEHIALRASILPGTYRDCQRWLVEILDTGDLPENVALYSRAHLLWPEPPSKADSTGAWDIQCAQIDACQLQALVVDQRPVLIRPADRSADAPAADNLQAYALDRLRLPADQQRDQAASRVLESACLPIRFPATARFARQPQPGRLERLLLRARPWVTGIAALFVLSVAGLAIDGWRLGQRATSQATAVLELRTHRQALERHLDRHQAQVDAVRRQQDRLRFEQRHLQLQWRESQTPAVSEPLALGRQWLQTQPDSSLHWRREAP